MAKEQTEITRKSISELLDEANKSENTDQSPANGITASDLEKLEGMSKDDLITLVRRIPSVPVAHALLTKEEKRERLKEKVFGIAMDSTNESAVLKAANDWLDREDGKAMQQIRQETHVTGSVALISSDEVTQIIANWLHKPQVIDNASS